MADDDPTVEIEEVEEEKEEEVFTAEDRNKLKEALRKERAEKKALEKYLTPEERRSAKNPKPSDMPGAKRSSEENDTQESRRDVDEQIKRAKMETEDKFRPLIAKSAARAALASNGATGDLNKMVRMLDLGELDISDDGDVDGLDEQIEELKKDFPALFRSDDKGSEDDLKMRRRSRGSADGGPKKGAVRKSASEIQAKALGY